MRKKLLFVVAASVFCLSVMAQNTVQKVSEKVSVTFPGKPEELKPGGDAGPTVYSYKKDSSIMYSAMGYDLSGLGLTAEAVASMGDALWDQMIPSMTAQFGGATLTKSEKSTFKDKSAYYLEIDGTTSTAPNLKGKKAFMYMFFIGASLHQFSYYTDKKDATLADGKSFFDTVTIDK